MRSIKEYYDSFDNKEILASLTPELSFEISESHYTLNQIIAAVEQEYPKFKFSRIECRYDSCIMAIFEPRVF